MSDLADRLNTALGGRYRIERKVGEGGMATVFLATDLKHNRSVALKVLKPEVAAVIGAARFLAEIETTANLQHPHILPLFDSGEANGSLYYVTPFLEGESLRGRIDRERQLPVDESVVLAQKIAGALDYAHEHGVIHRDIKPANVLLGERGEPLVADFGIALAAGSTGGERMTETGISLGSPHYMSPEQATGDQHVGPATDIYALGCVLYEMLVGEPPHTGTTPQVILGKIIAGEPVSATKIRSTVPPNVDATIGKSLEKLPADRFSRAQSFAIALSDSDFRHGELPAPSTAGYRLWNPLSVTMTIVALVLAFALTWSRSGPEPQAAVARFERPLRDDQRPGSFTDGTYAVSSDGSVLIYRGPREEVVPRLWVRRWDDLDAQPIPGTENGLQPAVSPDGRELAFSVGGRIFVVPMAGGPSRQLMTASWPTWGPDGHVYARTDSGIVRVPASGGTPELLWSDPVGGVGGHFVTDLLPGGEIALTGVGLGGSPMEVRALDLATGETTVLLPGMGLATYAASGHLVFRRGDTNTLMAADFDLKALELTGEPVPLIESLMSYSLSETGTLFYTTTERTTGNETELVWVTRAGESTPVEAGWIFDRGGRNFGWTLSPDDSGIAVRMQKNGNHDIWIKELPDGPERRLTFDEGDQRTPFWSPDGRTLTYMSGVTGDRNLWFRQADGTGAAQPLLDHELSFGEGVWSPDGEWIVLRIAALPPAFGERDLHGLRRGSDTLTPLLTNPEFREQGPALSHDGRWLAYGSDETGREEIFVRPFPNVEAGKFQVSTEGGIGAVWAHSGRELFFVNAERQLVAARVETESGFRVLDQEALFRIPDDIVVPGDGSVDFYDISLDDYRFLMGREVGSVSGLDTNPRFFLVQNYFAELRRLVP